MTTYTPPALLKDASEFRAIIIEAAAKIQKQGDDASSEAVFEDGIRLLTQMKEKAWWNEWFRQHPV